MHPAGGASLQLLHLFHHPRAHVAPRQTLNLNLCRALKAASAAALRGMPQLTGLSLARTAMNGVGGVLAALPSLTALSCVLRSARTSTVSVLLSLRTCTDSSKSR